MEACFIFQSCTLHALAVSYRTVSGEGPVPPFLHVFFFQSLLGAGGPTALL